MAPVRRPGEEDLARARWERALHRLRRRRPRHGGRARRSSASSETPARRASRPTGCSSRTGSTTTSSLRSRRRRARRRGRLHRRSPGRPADRRAGAREGRAPCRERAEQGADLVLGGSRIEGQFFQPSILTGVTPEMPMSREETFGPVAGIARFATEEEAVRIANDTPYGLSAYYFSGISAASACRRGARVRHRRRQHRSDLDRGGAVRRRQGVRHRPRGLVLRRRRLGRAQVLGVGGVMTASTSRVAALRTPRLQRSRA